MRSSERPDQVFADPRVLGPARARGDQQPVGLESARLGEGDGVVAVHQRFGSELTEVLHQVVDERVVVVHDEDPGHVEEATANRMGGRRGAAGTRRVGPMPRKTKDAPGRVTPKGGATRARTTSSSSDDLAREAVGTRLRSPRR